MPTMGLATLHPDTANHRVVEDRMDSCFPKPAVALKLAHEGRRQAGISVGLLADKGWWWELEGYEAGHKSCPAKTPTPSLERVQACPS